MSGIYSLPAQITFDKKYRLGYNNVFTSHPVAGHDTTYTFLHYARDSAHNRLDFGLCRLDDTGKVLLSKSFNIKNMDYLLNYSLKQFYKMSSSSYLVAGVMWQGANYGAVFTKVNGGTLDTVKTSFFYDSDFYYDVANILKLSSNKYYLAGTRATTLNAWPVMLCIDSNLVVADTIVVNTTNHVTGKVIYNPVSRKVLMGHRFSPSATVHFHNIGLMEVDTLGVITNTYMSTSTYSFFAGTIYFSAPDSSYVVVGGQQTFYYNGLSRARMNISKYGMDLKLRWRKSYGDEGNYNELAAATILPDGSIIACGRYSQWNMNNYNGVLLKVDRNGVPQWLREYDHFPGTSGWHEMLLGVEPALDGGLIIVGDIFLQPKGTAWVIKTDSVGCVTPGCASGTVSVDSLLLDPADPGTITAVYSAEHAKILCQLYPNPSQGQFVLKVAGTTGKLQFEVADALGRVVSAGQVSEEQQAEFGEHLPAGLYVIRITSGEGEVLNRQRIIKK